MLKTLKQTHMDLLIRVVDENGDDEYNIIQSNICNLENRTIKRFRQT
jgi:hypothetical protein